MKSVDVTLCCENGELEAEDGELEVEDGELEIIGVGVGVDLDVGGELEIMEVCKLEVKGNELGIEDWIADEVVIISDDKGENVVGGVEGDDEVKGLFDTDEMDDDEGAGNEDGKDDDCGEPENADVVVLMGMDGEVTDVFGSLEEVLGSIEESGVVADENGAGTESDVEKLEGEMEDDGDELEVSGSADTGDKVVCETDVSLGESRLDESPDDDDEANGGDDDVPGNDPADAVEEGDGAMGEVDEGIDDELGLRLLPGYRLVVVPLELEPDVVGIKGPAEGKAVMASAC